MLKYLKLLEDEQVDLEGQLVQYELIHTGEDHFILKGEELYKVFNALPYDKNEIELLKGIHGALLASLDRGNPLEIYKSIKYSEESSYDFGGLVSGKYTLNNVPELSVSLDDKQIEKFKLSEKDFIKEDLKSIGKELRQLIVKNLETRAQMLLCGLEALFFYVRENDEEDFYESMTKEEILAKYRSFVKEAASTLGFDNSKTYDAQFPEELFNTDSKFALWKITYKNVNIQITATVDTKELRSEDNISGLKGLNFSLKTDKVDDKEFKGFALEDLSEKIKAIVK